MKVKFIPQNVELEIEPSKSVMQLAHENQIPIKSVCNGMPSCAECRVQIVEGEENVLPPGVKELNLIGTGYFIDRRRLSCQLLCFGDVTIDLTEQVEKAKETASARKFIAKHQKDAKDQVIESYAVSGNLIEQDQSFKDEPAVEARPAVRHENPRRPHNRNRRGRR